MSISFLRLFILTVVLIFSVRVFAHARITDSGGIVPRSNNAGIKVGPCGGLARSLNAPVLQAGSTITLNWIETINHPGRFEFYFSPANEQGFQLLKTVIDDQNATNNLPHMYSTTITLPTTNCTDCTLQMIQVMTENPAAPTFYYSCADIQITGGTPPVVGPAPAPAPVPTPTPAPGDECH